MGELGNLTYRDVARKLHKLGFIFFRQAAGSHEVWRNAENGRKITISNHKGNMKENTVRAILKQAGVEIDDFLKA